MSLPNGSHSEDVIRTKPFEDYIRDHIVSWFTWAQKNELGVDMEDLILVTGCTLATSWAVATFMENNMDPEAEVSLTSRMLSNGGTDFIWSKIQGPVKNRHSHFDAVRFPGYAYSAYTDFCLFLYGKDNPPMTGRQNPPLAGEQDPTTGDQCVFIRGFRAKRVFFFGRRIQAAAEPQSDDPDNRRDHEIQVTGVPGVPNVSILLITLS